MSNGGLTPPKQKRTKYDKSGFAKYGVDGKTPRCQRAMPNKGDSKDVPEGYRQCRNAAVAGSNLCHKHGGRAVADGTSGGQPRPEARYSNLIPARFRSQFEKYLGDPGLLDIRPDIALLHIRLEDIMGSLEDHAIDIRGLDRGIKLLESAMQEGKPQLFIEALNVIKASAHSEKETRAIWNEVRSLLSQRIGFVQIEHQRVIDSNMAMPFDEVMGMLMQIRRLILENVSDPQARIVISNGLARIGDMPSSSSAPGVLVS